MNRLNQRIDKVEMDLRKQSGELPLIRVEYVSNWREGAQSEIPDLLWELLKERSLEGYSRRYSLPDDGGYKLRTRLLESPDPKAFIEGLSMEEFSGMMNAIGYYVGPGFPTFPCWNEPDPVLSPLDSL